MGGAASRPDIVVPIVFPDYKIETDTVLGKVGGLGHAGVLIIQGATGATKYYEYGRYDPAAKGLVQRRRVPDVATDADGRPTREPPQDPGADRHRRRPQGADLRGLRRGPGQIPLDGAVRRRPRDAERRPEARGVLDRRAQLPALRHLGRRGRRRRRPVSPPVVHPDGLHGQVPREVLQPRLRPQRQGRRPDHPPDGPSAWTRSRAGPPSRPR